MNKLTYKFNVKSYYFIDERAQACGQAKVQREGEC